MKQFNTILISFITLIFILNINHTIQQGTFIDVIKPASENLISAGEFQYYRFDNDFKTYPMWGYSLLNLPDSILNSKFLILFFQVLFTFFGLHYFYKIFSIEKSYYHLLLFIPFIALLSAKMPDSPSAFLILPIFYYLKQLNLKSIIIAGLLSGVLINIRSEYQILIMFFAVFLLIKSVKFKNKLIYSILYIILSFLLILPWGIRSYNNNGKFITGSTNGMAVMYNCLGQLPGNKWGITPLDSSAFAYVNSKSIDNAYSIEGEAALKKEVINLIKQEPFEFIKKSIYNLSSAFMGGLYIGEYATLFMDYNERYALEKQLNSVGSLDKISFLINQPPTVSFPFILEKLIRLLSIPLFLFLLLYFFYDIKKIKNSNYLLILMIVLQKLMVVSLIQYEYRHLNFIYLFLLGYFLLSPMKTNILRYIKKSRFSN